VESGKWNRVSCRLERLRDLDEALEEQLILMKDGQDVSKRDTVQVKPGGAKCLVLGDSIVRNVGEDKTIMRVECFPGIRADQLCRVLENRNFGCSDTVVIHVGTNDVVRSRNLDYVMGDVYDLMNTVKKKFPGSKLVLSGVLRRKGVSWQRVGATNDRLEWVAGN
jgi:hypothetical protein